MDVEKELQKHVLRLQVLVRLVSVMTVALIFAVIFWLSTVDRPDTKTVITVSEAEKHNYWRPPDISAVQSETKRREIEYGKDLIAHTAKYFGPHGSIKPLTNGLNCQNCHMDAGTKTFGNNYGAVAATYPKYRARSGQVESIEKRVNDCFERSLNGRPLDTASKEMHALVAYIKFLGAEVKPANLPEGIGLKKIPLLARAADPVQGKRLYESQCATCHGTDGAGKIAQGAGEYQFPPLWGKNSYNNGAGLYRLSNFARFIYSNMPLGATFENPVLTEEQAWDIAAYVNSLPRPEKDLSKDWPEIESKPFDHPFGPFADPYPETQHKFGPFKEIQTFYSSKEK